MKSPINKNLNISSRKLDKIDLGAIADRDMSLEERKQGFKEAVLHPFVRFFIRVNLISLVMIGLLALVETIMIVKGYQFERIVTEKVLIAIVVAAAAQTAAIIIAAFKGLFGTEKR